MTGSNNSTYEEAYNYYKQSDYKRSIELLKKLDDVKSKRLLAGIYANAPLEERNIDESIRVFKDIVPYDKLYAYELGSLLYLENRKREALDYYLQAISDEVPAASYQVAYLYKELFGREDLFIKYLKISAKQKYLFAKEALFSYRNRKKIYRPIRFIYRIYMLILHTYYIVTNKHKERCM